MVISQRPIGIKGKRLGRDIGVCGSMGVAGVSPSDEAPRVDAEIEGANGDSKDRDEPSGKIGIDDGVERVEQEAAVIGGEAGAGFEILFGECERARPRPGFGSDSPEQSKNMECAPKRTAAREERTEDDQGDPKQMNDENENGG